MEKKMIKNIKHLLAAILMLLIGLSNLTASEPYVILVSFDGFRWDYPNRGITPNFEKMAENGVRALSFKPAFPTSTFPNHYSIITGMYPDRHGIIANHFKNYHTGEEYTMMDRMKVKDDKWYQGEAFWTTAERVGIKCASMFWVGSEQVNSHPTYFKDYDHNFPYADRINGVIDWLKLPEDQRPHFITLYFHETDSKGHYFGPEADSTNIGIKLLDTMLGQLISKVDSIGMKDSVNIIVVSDHGMSEVSKDRMVDMNKLLKDFDCDVQNFGPYMMIDPKDNEEKIFNLLYYNQEHYHVYKKGKLPKHLSYGNNPLLPKLFLLAENGWMFKFGDEETYLEKIKGAHGFDNSEIDMHGVFYAMGPAFKKGLVSGTLENVDIYPLLAKIFNIPISHKIDGKIKRIQFVLKEK
jgi:ectonucleotide pyrophosphatase/phosphodiesterase family protein 5